jgi:hypothetical protein
LALATGIFLFVFDFVVENLGAIYGFWISKNSYLFILAVPIEVILTYIFGGAAWAMMTRFLKWNKKIIIISLILWSIGGTIGEYYLNSVNFMEYGNAWQSIPHALIAYLITFLILYKFVAIVKKKF